MSPTVKIAILLVLVADYLCAQSLPTFMGRKVTMTVPELDADGFYPKGPASICVEAPPQKQCYTAPKDFGRAPAVMLVELKKGTPALRFSAASGGVSGSQIHFALLRPGAQNDLDDLFTSGVSVSDQSQHAFWNDGTISDAQIFVMVEDVWGPGESHFSEHRYIVSAYVLQPSSDVLDYYLDDQYMTVRKYHLGDNANILDSEKPEILARLKRVAAQRRTAQ
jgi:hypothetical protein